jgi:hypothetical protein
MNHGVPARDAIYQSRLASSCLAAQFLKSHQPHINADLYLSISSKITPKIHSTTRKTTPCQCSLGIAKKKINHKTMQIIGIFGPSVNHSLMAATQNRPKAINPNGIILVRRAIVG